MMINGKIWYDNNHAHINAHGGHIISHHGSWYWYGEHKTAGESGRLAWHGVHAYRSTDLKYWIDCGIVLTVTNDPASPICKGCRIERPKVIFCEKTGKFAMYFHSTDVGHTLARCGVAVADNPLGPFQFLYAERPQKDYWPLDITPAEKSPQAIAKCPPETDENMKNGENKLVAGSNIIGRDMRTGQMARDLTLFVDDDKSAYHIYSSEHNSTLHISRLSDDYLNHSGTYTRAFKGRWMEAPIMFKRDARYYLLMSGCTGWAPNAARGAYADNIWGPWTEFGNPCEGIAPENGNGPNVTFGGQGACAFKHYDEIVVMLDLWDPENFIDSRYQWLPVRFQRDGTYKLPYIRKYPQ